MSANTNQASKTAMAYQIQDKATGAVLATLTARQAEAWAIKPYSGPSDPRRQMRLVPLEA